MTPETSNSRWRVRYNTFFHGKIDTFTRWFPDEESATLFKDDLVNATNISMTEVSSQIAVTFTGLSSGDMECFCWDDVPREDLQRITDVDEFEPPGRLYPDAIMRAIGVDPAKRYRFLVMAEEI